MKKYLLLILLLMSTQLAGQSYADSLRSRLPELEGNQRYEVLRALTILLRNEDPPRSLYYAFLQAKYAKENKISAYQLAAWENLAVAWLKNDSPAIAAELVEKILADYQAVAAVEKIAETRLILAEIYFRMGQYQSAENQLLAALRYYNQKQNQIKIAEIFLHLGQIYYEIDKPETASQYFDSALKLSKKNKQEVLRADIHFAWAEYQAAQPDFSAALDNFVMARNFYENNVIIDKLVDSIIKESELNLQLGNNQQTLAQLSRMNKLLQRIGHDKNRLLILIELAQYSLQDSSLATLPYLQEIENILQQAPLNYQTWESSREIKNIYQALQDSSMAELYQRKIILQKQKLQQRDLASWQQIEEFLNQQKQALQTEYQSIKTKTVQNNLLWTILLTLIMLGAFFIIMKKYKKKPKNGRR